MNPITRHTGSSIVLAALILIASCGAVLAEPIQLNGSFEEGTNPGGVLVLNPGSTAIDHWVVTRGQIDYTGNYWQHADGARSLDLNGSPGQGGVAQTLPTMPGQEYQVTFEMAGNPVGPPTIKQLRVEAAGQSADFSFDITGKSRTNMGWTTKTWAFTAVDTQTVLEFYSTTPFGSFGPALDDVEVTYQTAPPGEPLAIEVAQESAPGAGDFDANVLGFIETVDSPLTAEAYYSYGSPVGASYNGEAPAATQEVTYLFVLNTTGADTRSLIVVHDGVDDSDGGAASSSGAIEGDPDGAVYLVTDDPGGNDTYSMVDGAFASNQFWATCCTDGHALGTLEGEWEITLRLDDFSGLQQWLAYSGTGETIPLSLTPGRTVRIRPAVVPPADPELSFSIDAGFNGIDGIDPDSGNESVPIEYRVVYRSEDGIPPAGGMPHVIIEADSDPGTSLLGEGSFVMSPVDANETYAEGRTYRFTTHLPFLPGYTYEYRFEATDSLGSIAIGEPTEWHPGPASNTTDIAIYADGINFEPAWADTGEVFTIEAQVHNQSLETVTDVRVQFYDEESGLLVDELQIASIPAGSWVPVFASYLFDEAGFYPIRVVVDACCPGHEEWNELNNTAVRGIIVGDYELDCWIDIDGTFTSPICFRDTGWASGMATYQGLPIEEMPVRGAQVTVRLPSTGQQFQGVTNDEGRYQVEVDVDALPIGGPYDAEIEITDFTVTGETEHEFEIVACPALADLALSIDFNANCFVGGEIRPIGGRVMNHGVIPAEEFWVRIYVDGTDHFEQWIPFLDVGGIIQLDGMEDLTFSVGNEAVWHSVYGIADPENAIDEYRLNNNIVSIPFRVWPTCPDAVAAGIYLSDNTPATDQLIAISGRVINMGGVPLSGPIRLGLYDRLGAGEFEEIGLQDVASPAPCGGISHIQANHRFEEAGTHMVRLEADPDRVYENEECMTTNNTLDRAIGVHDPIPDFLVRYEELTVDNPWAVPGDSIRFITTVRNAGESDYDGSVPVGFRLDDQPYDPQEEIPDGVPLGGARACSSAVFWTGQWVADPDSHRIAVDVDPSDEIPEIYEFNNETSCRLPVDFLFLGLNDCQMFQDTEDPFCDEVLVDDEVQIHARIANYGCLPAPEPIEVRFYDDFLGTSTLIGTDWIESIGSHRTERFVEIAHAFAPTDVGEHTIRVEIDEDHVWNGVDRWAEYSRANNTLLRQLRVVTAHPDITLSSQHINPSLLTPCEGDSVTVTVTVWNEGLLDAETFHVRTKIDSTDFGSLYEIPHLGYEQPNYVSFVTDSIWVVTAEDTGPHAIWIISDCLDEVVEMDEDNNEATRVLLVCEEVPDLYVMNEDLTVAPLPGTHSGDSIVGQRLLLNSTIRNSGGIAGEGTVRFYYQTSPQDSIFIGGDDIFVAPGDSASAEVTWVAEVDSCVIKAVISGEDQEVNYTNNMAVAVFHQGHLLTDVQGVLRPEPRLAVLHQNAPNPFNPSTTIRFDLPGTRRVTLRIFDVNGRRIRTLIEEPLPAGRYALRWDGRNDEQKPVAGGVYFCRMQAGSSEQTRKMILLK